MRLTYNIPKKRQFCSVLKLTRRALIKDNTNFHVKVLGIELCWGSTENEYEGPYDWVDGRAGRQTDGRT